MPDGSTLHGRPTLITDSYAEAVSGADILLLCLPGFAIKEELERLAPFLSRSTKIGSIVSSTGFFFIAHEVMSPTQPLFGFQRVPFICRTLEYGHRVEIKGTKKELSVAMENIGEEFCSTLGYLFDSPVHMLGNYFEASLSNSNPLLHTSRLYTMLKDWDGTPFPSRPLFYEEWTEEATELYIGMDIEFQGLLKVLGIRDGAIPTVLDYYESADAPSLATKIRSIPAFRGILSPMRAVPGGFVPDFSSRYFTEDFPFGLKFIRDLAHQHHLECPLVDKVYRWGMEQIGK